MAIPAIFLPRKFPGQRRLVGYSSWSHKGTDAAKHSSGHIEQVRVGKSFSVSGDYSWELYAALLMTRASIWLPNKSLTYFHGYYKKRVTE